MESMTMQKPNPKTKHNKTSTDNSDLIRQIKAGKHRNKKNKQDNYLTCESLLHKEDVFLKIEEYLLHSLAILEHALRYQLGDIKRIEQDYKNGWQSFLDFTISRTWKDARKALRYVD